MKFTLIPPGEFDMGSSEQEIAQLLLEAQQQKAPGRYAQHVRNEGPQHRVRITRPFWMGVGEVTQAQYQTIMGSNPATCLNGVKIYGVTATTQRRQATTQLGRREARNGWSGAGAGTTRRGNPGRRTAASWGREAIGTLRASV